MELDHVPAALQARLGDEATAGLLQLLDRRHREARQDLISACTERFERRLVEEVAGVRLQMAQFESGIRHDMSQLESGIRRDMGQLESRIRQEMAELRASLREEIAGGRVDLLKWCFLFWIGQVLAISGIVGVMLRVMR